MALILAPEVPPWAARESRRAYKLNVLHEWEVLVRLTPADRLPHNEFADLKIWRESRQAHIKLSDGLRSAQGRMVVQHEFRHLFYWPLYEAVEDAVRSKFRHRLSEKETLALLEDKFGVAEHQRIALDLEAMGFPRFE
jgi:hypothetical protein